jgi:hypothetical protein
MEQTTHTQPKQKERVRPIFSAILPEGTLIEALYRAAEQRTLLCIFRDGEIRYEAEAVRGTERLVPYSPTNPLLEDAVVLLPTEPAEYGSPAALVAEIQGYIHRYVDLSPLYERIASYYVLFSWVYDAFPELPYLRVRGDYGSGKSRFLQIVGSVCYKPIFASGASTVSPLFRMIHAVRGTLLIDEGDFRFSGERDEVVKILNNGNAADFPVLRTEVNAKREFTPASYKVFGPKLIATRGHFEDRALESRCLTEEMGTRPLRDDIPLNATALAKEEALRLRNKLLLFRFRSFHKAEINPELKDRSLEPRLNQVFVPLLSMVEDPDVRRDLKELARSYQQDTVADRAQGTEAQVLEVIRDLLASQAMRPTVKEIANWFSDKHGDEYPEKFSARRIGGIIRKKLQLKTEKSGDGLYRIALGEEPKLRRLYEKYGLTEPPPAESGPEPSAVQSDFTDFTDFFRGIQGKAAHQRPHQS